MMLVLVPALTEAQPAAPCPQSGPLSEDQLTKLVKAVPAPRIGQLVASCGIDFEPDGGVIGRLRSAGASETVLDAVRAATGPAERKRQAEQALWESVKDSQDPQPFERFLGDYPNGQYAGAARDKLAAMKPSAPSPVPTSPVIPPTTIAAGTKELNPKDGLTYVWIPPGSFRMGCSVTEPECPPAARPAHEVTITRGFWLGQTAVTQSAYQRVTGKNPSRFDGASLPVEGVSWDEAQTYCRAVDGRLPTEAEWEYAAHAGDTRARYGEIDQIAWYLGNGSGRTHEVAQKKPNAWGLYDMLGNVWQWTLDWFSAYDSSPALDPTGPVTGSARVLRGDSWFNGLTGRRGGMSNPCVWDRVMPGPGSGAGMIGFRCVRESSAPGGRGGRGGRSGRSPTAPDTGPPSIAQFAAEPNSIQRGQSSALRWQVTGSLTAVDIDHGIGLVLNNGSRRVQPDSSVTYRLTATGTGGTVTATVAVVVTVEPQQPAPPRPTPPNIVQFSAEPNSIKRGDSSVLRWEVNGPVTSVSINQGFGTVQNKGSQRVQPDTSVTYNLSAVGPGGSAYSGATVSVHWSDAELTAELQRLSGTWIMRNHYCPANTLRPADKPL
jgi:formylglycine-generating enzyme required for sulfatase activity